MSSLNVSQDFKEAAVKKLLTSNKGAYTLAKEMNVSSLTLYYWKKKYANNLVMDKSRKNEHKTLKQWSLEEKLDVVIKTASMNEEELGEFLRSNGLYRSDLEAFKKDLVSPSSSKGRPRRDPAVVALQKKNKALTRELKRKDAALSEYAARVILLKKSHEIWGTNEDDE